MHASRFGYLVSGPRFIYLHRNKYALGTLTIVVEFRFTLVHHKKAYTTAFHRAMANIINDMDGSDTDLTSYLKPLRFGTRIIANEFFSAFFEDTHAVWERLSQA